MKFDDQITVERKDGITGDGTTIYTNIDADVQNNLSHNLSGGNSKNSELIDFFVYLENDKTDIKTGDLISFTDVFGENVILNVVSREYIPLTHADDYIQVNCKKK